MLFLFGVTLVENPYQISKGLENFVVLKVTEKEIQDNFSELNAKRRSIKRLQVKRQRGRRRY